MPRVVGPPSPEYVDGTHAKRRRVLDERAGMRTAMVQVVLTTAVVVSFLAATLLTQARARSVEPLVDEIVGNAVPSIEALSDARHATRRLATATAMAAGTPTEAARAPIVERLHDLDAAITVYHLQPVSTARPRCSTWSGATWPSCTRRSRPPCSPPDAP